MSKPTWLNTAWCSVTSAFLLSVVRHPYTTNDVYEAEIIRNQLHDAGIKCELDGESQGGFIEIVETKLLVRAGDADRARQHIERRTTDKFDPPCDEV